MSEDKEEFVILIIFVTLRLKILLKNSNKIQWMKIWKTHQGIWLSLNDVVQAADGRGPTYFKWHDGTYWQRLGFHFNQKSNQK